MRSSSPVVVQLHPVRAGWRIAVDLLGERREGVLRLRAELTWMQQRRALEERLRSWGVVVPAGTAWRRRPDGSLILAAQAAATEGDRTVRLVA